MSSNYFSIDKILFSLAIFIIIFLLIRGFNLWYWRINDIADSLKKISENTKKEEEKGEKQIKL